jgi:hypothetical protein
MQEPNTFTSHIKNSIANLLIGLIQAYNEQYLCSQPKTFAMPTNDKRNGGPALDAWIASSR